MSALAVFCLHDVYFYQLMTSNSWHLLITIYVCVCACMRVCVYKYINKYNLLNPFRVACMFLGLTTWYWKAN